MLGKKKQRKPLSLVLNERLYDASRKLGGAFASVSDFMERQIGEGLQGSGKSVKKLSGHLPWRRLASLGKPFLALGNLCRRPVVWIYKRLAALLDRLLPKWLSRVLAWPFVAVGRAVYYMIDFASLWWWTREFKKLLWAIPVFIMAAPLIACIILSPLYSRSAKIERYQQSMQDALDHEDQALADLCVAKLNQLGLNQLELVEYNAALTLADKGQFEAAVEKMSQLAPETAAGFFRAHTWLALQLWDGKIPEPAATKWDRFERHVRHALATRSDDPLARRLQVEVDLRHGNVVQAIDTMQSLVGYFPELNFDLMRHHQRQGDAVNARARARATVDYLQELDHRDQLLYADCLKWAAALEQLEQWHDAIDVLDQALTRYPDESQTITAVLVEVLVRAFWQEVEMRPATAYTLLHRAAKLSPADDRLLAFLATQLADGNPAATRFVDALGPDEDLKVKTTLLAGDVALRRSEYKRAMEFYERGCVIDPTVARGWNNVAWILGNVRPYRLKDALSAANRALQLDAGSPEYRETRGQIYLKLGRWQEAASDLRQALNGDLPNALEVHRALAKAYEELGEPEQAAAHLLLAGS